MWLFQDRCYTCSTRLFHMYPRCVAHVAQTLVPMGCEAGFSYNPNEHITYHFMWLFDSKLHEIFPGINIDSYWCETCEDTLITHPSIYLSIEPKCKRGCNFQVSGRVYFHRFDFGIVISTNLSCLSLNPLLSEWQTPGVLQYRCQISLFTTHPGMGGENLSLYAPYRALFYYWSPSREDTTRTVPHDLGDSALSTRPWPVLGLSLTWPRPSLDPPPVNREERPTWHRT
jgi:hypothetical protein